ncbi:hypothetical protein QCE63_21545 [Caballeronia sp. LZ065]|uniref:hypothetical protein n=1 Tax=Caballeronia sp. LZ065 TaxID=3038571 RepID=UPI0028667BCA|nr:hypothetical protein [Caballeronia sp. LZ065]MDR5781986.1 hypothetical protein [Caballeronia sp. LZ065]
MPLARYLASLPESDEAPEDEEFALRHADRSPAAEILGTAIRIEDYIANKKHGGMAALKRQEIIANASGIHLDARAQTHLLAYSYESWNFVNLYLRHGENKRYSAHYFPAEAQVAMDSPERVEAMIDLIDALPSTGDIALYRGSKGENYPIWRAIRLGLIREGHIPVNTDFTSFTENPHIVRDFAGPEIDESSVVFEVGRHRSIKALAPFSMRSKDPFYEAESLVRPGLAFVIRSISREVAQSGDRFQPYAYVSLDELPPALNPKLQLARGFLGSDIAFPGNVFDMRTGEPVDVSTFSERLGSKSGDVLAPYL